MKVVAALGGSQSLHEPKEEGEALKLIERAERAWVDLSLEEASKAEWLTKLGMPSLALERALSREAPSCSNVEGWCILKLPAFTEARALIHGGLSMVFNDRLIATLHPKDVRQPEEEMKEASPKLRVNAAYIVYQLAGRIVEDSHGIMERLEADLMRLEDEVVEGGGGGDILKKVLARKRRLLTLSRGLWALRDAVHSLRRASPSFIDQELDERLGQVCDEVDRLAEILETYKLMASDLINMHATSLSARLNITVRDLTLAMLYLTVVATVIGFPNTVATIFGVPALAEAIEAHWVSILIAASAVIPMLWLKSLWSLLKRK